MNILWVAVSVTIMAAPNEDGTPSANVVQHSYYKTEQECLSWKEDRYENDWGSVDPVTNKAVSQYIFECTVVFPDQVNEEIAQAMR